MSWAEDEGYDAYWGDEEQHPSIDFDRGYWTDKNGDRYNIQNMQVQHIKNCINILKRTQEKWDYPEEDLREIKAKIKEFQKELNRRHNFKGKAF